MVRETARLSVSRPFYSFVCQQTNGVCTVSDMTEGFLFSIIDPEGQGPGPGAAHLSSPDCKRESEQWLNFAKSTFPARIGCWLRCRRTSTIACSLIWKRCPYP